VLKLPFHDEGEEFVVEFPIFQAQLAVASHIVEVIVGEDHGLRARHWQCKYGLGQDGEGDALSIVRVEPLPERTDEALQVFQRLELRQVLADGIENKMIMLQAGASLVSFFDQECFLLVLDASREVVQQDGDHDVQQHHARDD
jgi:hypothetical protein